MKRHVGMLSSGVSSFIACTLMKAEAERLGHEAVLLFTDTQMEDQDCYRFLDECEGYLGLPLHRLQHPVGNPFDLFDQQGVLGSDRIPVCSRILKREQTEKFAREGDTLWWGIDIEENHRAEPIERNWLARGIASRFPLIETLSTHQGRFEKLAAIGIKPPRMYALGFAHANCGGICVRGKLGHWAHLYRTWPERYAYAEQREREWQELHSKQNTILRKSVRGERQNMSLREYREDYLEGQLFTDTEHHDSGSCACMESYAS